jgi:4-hydroxy-tetrahydrodipicolinate reductase
MRPGDLGVVGATGRLGSRIVAQATELGHCVTLRAGRGYWTGGVPDVLIDVSAPAMLPRIVDFCATHRIPLLSAISGLSDSDRRLLTELSRDVPVLRADNLSLGHYLQKYLVTALAAMVAGAHRPAAEWHVLDRHPSTKQHRPSATATVLAAALRSTGATDVGLDSVRGGLPVCDHTVETVIGQETVAVSHGVRDWSAYAASAVRAAHWLQQRSRPEPSPGLLTMDDYYAQYSAAAFPITAPPSTAPPISTVAPEGVRS